MQDWIDDEWKVGRERALHCGRGPSAVISNADIAYGFQYRQNDVSQELRTPRC